MKTVDFSIPGRSRPGPVCGEAGAFGGRFLVNQAEEVLQHLICSGCRRRCHLIVDLKAARAAADPEAATLRLCMGPHLT